VNANVKQWGHDPNEYDHQHEECERLPCPRCGCDPVTGLYVEEGFGMKRWSCSLCDKCWPCYEADMDPADRQTYVIEEQTL
jgi:formate dehydrogenase maturation protein FdhE